MNCKVTICIITYNQEDSVSKTLLSVLDQAVDDLQIIISDDASTDETPSILKSFKKKFPDQIDLILHKKNGGIAKNMTSFHGKIKGQYVCFLGGDDVYLPSKLKTQINFLDQNPDYIMCYHDVWVQEEASGQKYRFHDPKLGLKPHSGYIANQLIIERCFIPTLSMMLRYESVNHVRFEESVGSCNDWLYMIEVAMCGPIKRLEDILAIYYRHSNNVTRQNYSFRNEEKCYSFLENKYGPKYQEAIVKGRVGLYLNYIFKYAFAHKRNEALSAYKKLRNISKKEAKTVYAMRLFFAFLKRRFFLLLKTRTVYR